MPDERAWSDDPSFDQPVDLAAVRADDALLDAIASATFDRNAELNGAEFNGAEFNGAGPASLGLGRSGLDRLGSDRLGSDRLGSDRLGLGSPAVDLNRLGLGSDTDPAQLRLASVLLSWRRDIEAEPISELVSVERAAAAIDSGRRASRRRLGLAPLAAAAAALVIGFSGLALAAHTATPGDPLWAVSKVLYSQRADSLEAAETVSSKLDDARRALVAGKPEVAAAALQDAKAHLGAVRPEDGRNRLTADQSTLESQVAPAQTSSAAAPGRSASGSPGATFSRMPPGSAPHWTVPTASRGEELPTTVPTTTTVTAAPPVSPAAGTDGATAGTVSGAPGAGSISSTRGRRPHTPGSTPR